jgi:hypothetical protein
LTGYNMTASKSQNIILSKTVTQFQVMVTVAGTGMATVSTNPAGLTNTGGTIRTNLAAGWNLMGNGTSGTVDVASEFGASTQVSTVLKWVSGANPGWAFYAPSMSVANLATYAASKGYQVLMNLAKRYPSCGRVSVSKTSVSVMVKYNRAIRFPRLGKKMQAAQPSCR